MKTFLLNVIVSFTILSTMAYNYYNVNQLHPFKKKTTQIIIKKGELTEVQAISKVIKLHPEFPTDKTKVIIREEPGVGPSTLDPETLQMIPPQNLKVEYSTTCAKIGKSTYNITIKKDWKISLNDVKIMKYFEYRVTPEEVILLKKFDNEIILTTIK